MRLALSLLTAALLQAPAAEAELIVRWKPQATKRSLIAESMVRVRSVGRATWLYRMSSSPAAGEVERLLERLRSRPDVEYAEPNHVRRPFATPSDKWYPYQWNLKAINLERGWELSTGSSSLVVAVVDTGILPNHPDLQGRLLPGYDFILDKANSADGDSWDADPTDTDDKSSSRFHGTLVAGILGAASNNKLGITGVTWGCRILPVRALGVTGGKDSDIVAAIRWAAGLPVNGAPPNPTPAKVINLSFGDPAYGQTLADAIQDVQQRGVIVVAAAGNYNNSEVNYPAGYDNVISVGATRRDGSRAGYSNHGPSIDVMAPGGDIGQFLADMPPCSDNHPCPAGVVSTFYDSSSSQYSYRFYDGTSLAAPAVTGVVALMVSINPNLDARETLRVLRGTANPASQCTEGCGAGLIDAAYALNVVAGLATVDDARWTQSHMQGGPVYGGGCRLAPAETEADLAPVLALLALACLVRRRKRRAEPRVPLRS